jgi:hypothetical protein
MGTSKPLGSIGKKGDIHTLMDINPATAGQQESLVGMNPESSKLGMPFYFKDLRDGATLWFRAYLDGMSDSLSPNWTSENYIGRSEPVYTYTNAERELAFNLKLFAQTKDELNMIYKKMNRLTSLCYPEYKNSWALHGVDPDTAEGKKAIVKAGDRTRMKPPLVKLRIGELFGYKDSSSPEGGYGGMTGFIKSLTYTFPDESPWEIQEGYRVPKYITADITYQVIHGEPPSLDFANGDESSETFYGITQLNRFIYPGEVLGD